MMKTFAALQKKVGKFFVPLIMLVFSFVLFLLMYSGIKPAILDIQLYEVAENTIRANATVEDKAQTEANQKVAEENVAPVYSFNSETEKNQLSKVQILFVTIEEVQKEAEKQYTQEIESFQKKGAENVEEGSDDAANPAAVKPLTAEEKYALFENKTKSVQQETQEFISELPQWAITSLLEAPASTLNELNESLTSIISEKMAKPIRLEELNEAIEEAQDSFQYVELESTYQRIGNLILEHAIIENNNYNEQATEQARQEAVRNVQPVMILQGQVIVQEGHVVDSTDMHQLELLNMLDDEPSYYMINSLLALLVAQLLGVYFISKIESLTSQTFSKVLILYSLVVLVSVAMMKGLQLLQLAGINNIAFLYPAALASMLANAFLTPKFGYLVNTFLPAFSIFIYTGYRGTTNALVIALVYALSGLFGALMRRQKDQKVPGKLLWLMIVGNGIVMLSMIFYLNQPILTTQTLLMLVYSVLSGALAYGLATILIPYIDVYYTDNAVLTLTALSNPNQPLLRLLLTKTPGTYHHSLMVANLSANAVSAIGGDSLFTRVACYYHDVGKLTHPLFFVENLPSGMDNPHNLLTPYESKEIIFGHVSEGIKMLKEAKLPQSIIDICAQHHGTTLMKYFYAEAKKENSETNESDFRYPGPKPQTKEAAVINIADSAEAGCRSMSKPSKQSIEEFVHELIIGRIKDGQFDECDITMKELRIVEAALVDNLVGTFHSRIEYPKTEPIK